MKCDIGMEMQHMTQSLYCCIKVQPILELDTCREEPMTRFDEAYEFVASVQ